MKPDTVNLIRELARILYHPLSKVYAPFFGDSLRNALYILNVLKTENVYTARIISEITGLEFRYTKAQLNALKNGGLPFTQSGGGAGRSKQYWQLPKHPATSQLKRLKQHLFITS